ncbi:MAG: HAD hydrolase-like protein [Lachnospiraceae bacterium]|nr:HAD hydrolase-like protein [Lachnospiraceae bacterium]
MAKLKYEGILFDLDGTLLDTREGVKDAVALTHKELGMEIPNEETLQRFVGPPMQDSFVREYGFSTDEAQHAADIFRSTYMHKSLFLAELYPGVIQLLGILRAEGYKIGVATYKREDYAIRLLDHFGISDYCDVIHGGDNFNQRKKSDIVKMCIAAMNIKGSGQVILVGDSEYDAIGAETAGIPFFGLTSGYGFKDESYYDKYKAVGWGKCIMELINFL